MPGLDPGIHSGTLAFRTSLTAWIAGSDPPIKSGMAMTTLMYMPLVSRREIRAGVFSDEGAGR
jgi:hypothetical protein